MELNLSRFRICWCDINDHGVIVMVITPIQKALEIEKYIETFINDFDAGFYYTLRDYRTIVEIDSEKEKGILIIFRGNDFITLPEKLRYFIKTLELEYNNEGEKINEA